jgi:phenylpyruvate tautomerase PptA (4-oxalocrotonate tautomerase family)
MPLVTIYCSNKVADPEDLLEKVTSLVAGELGKPESITMARLEDEATLAFGGKTDPPSALFEIEGIELPVDKAGPLTERLCLLAEETLTTPQNRVFVKLSNVPRGMWGGNGKVY